MKPAILEAISEDALHVRVGEQRYRVPYDDYPVLRGASQVALATIVASPTTLRWPELDVDIALDALAHPEHYPLTFDHATWAESHPGT